jgi:flagellar basal-body rod protein FlgC
MENMLATMRVSAAGMKAQGTRLRVIAENIANADSLPTGPGDLPYRRKVVTFREALERSSGLSEVRIDSIGPDLSQLAKKYMPDHPAADDQGYVLAPNVDSLIEMMDMREAQRSYEANLNMVRTSKEMARDAINILR